MDKVVDALHRAIIGYLRAISLTNLSDAQSGQLMKLIQIANDLEHIGDQVATNIITSAGKRIDEGVRISEQTAAAILEFHAKVLEALNGALEAVATEDQEIAMNVRAMKEGRRRIDAKDRTSRCRASHCRCANAPRDLRPRDGDHRDPRRDFQGGPAYSTQSADTGSS